MFHERWLEKENELVTTINPLKLKSKIGHNSSQYFDGRPLDVDHLPERPERSADDDFDQKCDHRQKLSSDENEENVLQVFEPEPRLLLGLLRLPELAFLDLPVLTAVDRHVLAGLGLAQAVVGVIKIRFRLWNCSVVFD